MSGGSLTLLQRALLEALSTFEPRWTLTGGAALVGIHLGHRTTRDLDLFWHGVSRLDRIPDDVTVRLESAGYAVRRVQTSGTSSVPC